GFEGGNLGMQQREPASAVLAELRAGAELAARALDGGVTQVHADAARRVDVAAADVPAGAALASVDDVALDDREMLVVAAHSDHASLPSVFAGHLAPPCRR